MKKLPSLNLEVIRFTTEDVIVTSGGSNSVITDPVKSVFQAGSSYFTKGIEINETFNNPKVNSGYFYYFIPDTDGNTFLFNKYDSNMYESNAKNLKSGVIYAWHKNSGWYTDGLMKDAYFVNGEYDFPTN